MAEEYRVTRFEIEPLGTMAPDSSVQSARIDIFLARLDELPTFIGEYAESKPIMETIESVLGKLGTGEWTDSFLGFAISLALGQRQLRFAP